MGRGFQVLLAAAAVGAFVSCGSIGNGVGSSASVSSDAGTRVTGDVQARAAVPQLAEPAPAAAVSGPAEKSPAPAGPTDVSLATPGAPRVEEAALPLAAPRLPALPVSPRKADPGLVAPLGPRVKSVYGMALPVAPPLEAASADATKTGAIKAETTKPDTAKSGMAVKPEPARVSPSAAQRPAQRPATQPAASAAQNGTKPAPQRSSEPRRTENGGDTIPTISDTQGTVQGGGQSPQSTPGAGATVQQSAGQAPAEQQGSAQQPTPYGRLREIYARPGDELRIGLDGLGFLFLGFPDRGDRANGMSFKSKENRDNKTWFTFQAVRTGTYDLDFQQQDNSTGKTNKETVRVHVVSDQDFAAATAREPDSGGATTSNAAPGDPAFAARLAAAGAYDLAVAELLKGYQDGNPALNDQIAGLYVRMGSLEAAEKYYAKNLSPAGSFTQSAVLGLTRIAVAQKDQQAFMELLKQFLAVDDPSAEQTLIQAVRMEKELGQVGVGLDLAGVYTKRFPSGQWRDEADFLSAQMLEADTAFRDIARARDLYRGIVTGFPESQFAETARQRLLYIDRHFFQVR